MPTLNFGPKAERFAMRPPEFDRPINILEGAVRSGKTWCLHTKAIYGSNYQVGGRKIITGVSKQSVYNNVLSDLFNILGPRNCSYNRDSGQLKLCGSEWLVIGAKDEGSEKYIRGLTVGIALCDEISLMPQSFFRSLELMHRAQGGVQDRKSEIRFDHAALLPEVDMDRIFRYEERMHRYLDWAVQRLFESQERRRITERSISRRTFKM